MSCNDTTPHNTVLAHCTGSSLLRLDCFVDICESLAQVVLSVLAIFDALDLNPRLSAMLVAAIALVSEMDGLDVKSDGSSHSEMSGVASVAHNDCRENLLNAGKEAVVR